MTAASLTDAEIADICRPLTQHAAQVRYLRALGLTVQRRPDGSPIVRRSEWDLRKEGERIDLAVLEQPEPPKENNFARLARERREFLETPEGKAALAEEMAADEARKSWADALAAENRRIAVDRRRALVLHHANKRRALKLQRTPPWADMSAIRAVYEHARRLSEETGVEHHVDHEFPLQGKKVSGLHVAENLRPIPAQDNIRKSNRYEP